MLDKVNYFVGNDFSSVFDLMFSHIRKEKLTRCVGPRGKQTIEFAGPTSWTIHKPWNCWQTRPDRKINPFFAAAEIFWILGGNDNVDWICRFNENMRTFADKGHPTFNAGYGNRIRRYPFADLGVDQVLSVVKRLKEDKHTRRAVIGLWHPLFDNRKSNDIACVSGETIVRSPEGDIKASELHERFSSGAKRYPVYSFNEKTRDIEFKWCTGTTETRYRNVLSVQFDDETFLKCTEDHLVYRKLRVHGGKFPTTKIDIVEASELKIGDRLWATKLFEDDDGYLRFIKNLSKNHSYDNQCKVHKEYYEWVMGRVPDDHDVHHVDTNKLNNSLGNLMSLYHDVHSSLNMFGDDNPMRRMSDSDREKKGSKYSKKLSGRKRPEHSEFMKEYWEQKRTNHKIVDIIQCGYETVYDLHVEDNHNFVVGSGVIVHNCNNMVYFLIRNNKLHTTVIIRSNDLVWGTPYNMLQFQHLALLVQGEYNKNRTIKNIIGRGTHTVVANSLHLYLNAFDKYDETVDRISKTTSIEINQDKCQDPITFQEFDMIYKRLDSNLKSLESGGSEFNFGLISLNSYWEQLAAMAAVYLAKKHYGIEKEEILRWAKRRLHPVFSWLIADFWNLR